jgi:hypothetical protein
MLAQGHEPRLGGCKDFSKQIATLCALCNQVLKFRKLVQCTSSMVTRETTFITFKLPRDRTMAGNHGPERAVRVLGGIGRGRHRRPEKRAENGQKNVEGPSAEDMNRLKQGIGPAYFSAAVPRLIRENAL